MCGCVYKSYGMLPVCVLGCLGNYRGVFRLHGYHYLMCILYSFSPYTKLRLSSLPFLPLSLSFSCYIFCFRVFLGFWVLVFSHRLHLDLARIGFPPVHDGSLSCALGIKEITARRALSSVSTTLSFSLSICLTRYFYLSIIYL